MRRVSSPTWVRRINRPWARLLAVAAVVLGLMGAMSTPGLAKSLTDQRNEVRKQIVAAKDDIEESSDAVSEAAAKLAAAQKELSRAQAKLAQVKVRLRDAKTAQAATAAALKAAQEELAQAKEATRQAKAEVEAQRDLIGVAARTQFQQQTDLVGLGMLLGAESPADLAQRLQWTTTIFDTTTAAMNRLEQSQARLAAAEKASVQAEKKIEAQNKKAKELVASVQKLTNAAAAQEAEVTRLVASKKKVKAAADAQLAEDESRLKNYEKKQGEIEAAIKKAAEEERKRLAAAKKKAQDSATVVDALGGFARPVPGASGSPFGMRYHPILHYWRMHWGLDMHASCGTPIVAMADGRVTSTLSTSRSGGLGNWTVISYGIYKGKSLSSGYAHQSRIIVSVGQSVSRGQVVGYVGTTGLSTGCHLHLQMYENGVRVNPAKYVP